MLESRRLDFIGRSAQLCSRPFPVPRCLQEVSADGGEKNTGAGTVHTVH